MTENCGTCQHWNRARTDFRTTVTASGYGYSPPDRETRYAAAHAADQLFGLCTRIPMGPANIDDVELPLALAMDGSQYIADVYTRAEFGCVLHNPRHDFTPQEVTR